MDVSKGDLGRAAAHSLAIVSPALFRFGTASPSSMTSGRFFAWLADGVA
jgi:hypothetical protein